MIDESVFEGKKKKSKLTPSQASDAISRANQEWFTFTQQINPLMEDSREAWQLYLENRPEAMAYSSSEEASDGANIRTSVIAQAVDSVHAQQHLTNFPDQENFFSGRPMNEMAKTNRKLVESYMTQEMKKMDFLTKAFQDRKNLLLDGTSVVALPFKRKVKQKAVYSWKKFFGIEIPIGKPKKSYKEVVVTEGTDFIPLRFEDWRVDPTIPDWNDSPFLYKYYQSIDSLQATDAYQNTEGLTTYSDASDNSEFLKIQKLMFNGITAPNNLAVGTQDTGLAATCALVMERWGDFWIDDKLYENHVMVWANESVLLYFGENPYDHQERPFALSPYTPVPNSPYGKSSIKDAIPEAHALDALKNQMLDIISLSSPWFTYVDKDTTLEAYMDEGGLVLSPGKGVPVKSHESIKERSLPIPNLDWIGNIMTNLKEDIRESTGGVPYATGGINQTQNDRTLGEVQILANGTSTRFMSLVGFYEQTKLYRYADQFFENARQFVSDPVYVSDFEKIIAPETLKMMEMDFEITGSRSVMEKNNQQQAKLNFVQNILPPMLQAGYAITNGSVLEIDTAEMAKGMAVDAGIKDVDDLMKVITRTEEISQQADNPLAEQLAGGMNGLQPVQQANAGPEIADLGAA